MSAYNKLKRLFILPFRKAAPIISIGSVDTWDIVDPGSEPLFVIAASVGKNITFEQDLAVRWPSRVILLDLTPTGVETMDFRFVSTSKLKISLRPFVERGVEGIAKAAT